MRSATIITNRPEELTKALLHGFQRGVSHWQITGGYSGQNRSMLLCIIYRSQVHEIRQIVAAVDPEAFVVIGDAHQAYGRDFIRLKSSH